MQFSNARHPHNFTLSLSYSISVFVFAILIRRICALSPLLHLCHRCQRSADHVYLIVLRARRYINSVRNVPRVARYLARFIRFLIENGIDMEHIRLIGFSLGAEVAGFAGKTLKEWNLELPRITGELIENRLHFMF